MLDLVSNIWLKENVYMQRIFNTNKKHFFLFKHWKKTSLTRMRERVAFYFLSALREASIKIFLNILC